MKEKWKEIAKLLFLISMYELHLLFSTMYLIIISI